MKKQGKYSGKIDDHYTKSNEINSKFRQRRKRNNQKEQ